MTDYKRCILIMADGARADIFDCLLKKGDLPNISKYIIDKGDYRHAVTVFPSTTGPAYTPFILGKFPGRCNFPGIRWFDKKEFSKTFFSLKRFRSYIGPESYFMNNDISERFKTIFELIPNSVSILNELTRGISKNADKTKYSKIFYKLKSHFTYNTNEVDQISQRLILESFRNSPQFIFAVFLGIDNYSHHTHPFHKLAIDSYFRIDRYIGELVEALKKKGQVEETLLVLVSDHGLTQTHSHFDLLEFINDSGFKTLCYPYVFKHLFNATAANMISGNSMSNLYFKSGNRWNGFNINQFRDLVQNLLDRPEVDIILYKNTDNKIDIKSQRGIAKTWIDCEGNINYEVLNSDPFGYEPLPLIMTTDQVLQFTYNTDYPDSLLQINQLFDSPRAGDIIVTAKNGFDLRARHENPEHCSSHGSLFKDHMIVPIAINTKISKNLIRTVDLFPSILELLNYQKPEELDGISFVS